MEVKKAIIPIAGLGTRFLPLSKVVPKEFFPLADRPVIQYIIKEACASGIKEIIFINRLDQKKTENYLERYFERNLELEKLLKFRKKFDILNELKFLEKTYKNISFSYAYQKKPLGDGHALLQAEKLTEKKPFAVSWADDIVESKIPCLTQLIKVFKKYKKPVLALYKIPKESFHFYGMAGVKKISNRVYKIKKIVEKPQTIEESPSNFAIVGKYIFTPRIFDLLKKASFNKNKEIITDEVMGEAIRDGEEIYGCEFEGKWLECGNKLAYLKSNFYLSLKHPQFGPPLKKYLKAISK